MSENENSTCSGSADPDDAPEWTPEMFELAEYSSGGRVVRPARGKLTDALRLAEERRSPDTLELDDDVVERLRRTGPNWRVQANDILRRAVGL